MKTAAVILLLLALPTASRAQVSIGVYEDPAGFDCHAPMPAPGSMATYYVVAHQRVGGIAGVRFAVPLPPCLGVTYLGEASPFPATFGDSQNGIEISFDSCKGETGILLVSIHVFQVPGAGEACCKVPVVPDPGDASGEVTYLTCALEVRPAHGRIAWLNENGACEVQAPARNPQPPAYATGVTLPVILDWESPLPDYCEEPVFHLQHDVYLGTTTDPPLIADHVQPPLDPGPLLPATTYYWRVHAYSEISSVTSQLWRFTTGNALPARASTWGAIKALYR